MSSLLIGGHRFLNYCVDIGGDGAGADDVSDILLQCDVFNPKLFGVNRITTIALCDDCLFCRRRLQSSPEKSWYSFLGIIKAARLAVYMARNTTANSAQILDMNLGGVNKGRTKKNCFFRNNS